MGSPWEFLVFPTIPGISNNAYKQAKFMTRGIWYANVVYMYLKIVFPFSFSVFFSPFPFHFYFFSFLFPLCLFSSFLFFLLFSLSFLSFSFFFYFLSFFCLTYFTLSLPPSLSLSPSTVVCTPLYIGPVGWGCRIHPLYLCRGVRLPQRVSWIWH